MPERLCAVMNLNDCYLLFLIIMTEVFIVTIIAYLHTKMNRTITDKDGKINRKNLVFGIAIAAIVGLVTTNYLVIDAGNNMLVDIGNFPIMFSGLLAGPLVSVPASVIVGIEIYLSGGDTALPCMLDIIITGILSGALWYLSGKKFPTVLNATILMFSAMMIHFSLIILLTNNGMNIVDAIAPMMIIGNTICMVIASYLYHSYVLEEKDKVI